MKILYTIMALALSSLAFAQQKGELVIFSNSGEPFYVIMNGITQNYEPATNVRVQDLTDEWYDCKIVCPNNTFSVQKNVMVKKNMTVTYRLVENEGTHKLRYYSESELTNYASQPNQGSQSVIVFHMTAAAPPVSSQTTTTTHTTSTTSSGIGDGSESVNINVQVGENGMSTGIVTSDGGMNTTTTYSETMTVTTTQSTDPYIHNDGMYEEHHDHHDNYSTCSLDQSGFDRLKKSIEAESFSDDQLRIAKQAAKNKCMSVAQIKEIAQLFSFSSEQLAFTKAAYDTCKNKSDYYEVLEVFDFSKDKEELENYMNSH